jgi:hypothetical protein
MNGQWLNSLLMEGITAGQGPLVARWPMEERWAPSGY